MAENSRFQKRIKPGRYDRYTPLNATRETILQEACSLELIRLPRLGRPQPEADPTLRCNYHQSIRHNTEECTKVRDLIEELIQSGALASFVQKGQREGPRPLGTRVGRGGRFQAGRGRGRVRIGYEEGKAREPRVEAPMEQVSRTQKPLQDR